MGEVVRLRDYQPATRRSWAEVRALAIRRALTKLYRARVRQHLAIGSLAGWAEAAAAISAVVDDNVDDYSVARQCTVIGIVIPDNITRPIADKTAAARSAGHINLDAIVVGDLVSLTAAEREELEIRCITACDESDDDRAKRLASYRQAKRRRERGALPRSQSANSNEPWIELGVSRRTYYRRRREERLAQIRHAHERSNGEEGDA